jgi:hypothetical protein
MCRSGQTSGATRLCLAPNSHSPGPRVAGPLDQVRKRAPSTRRAGSVFWGPPGD